MDRKLYAELVRWKDSPGRKPLILEGVRQCGKTYLLKEFGRREYDDLAYFDFERDSRVGEFFDGDLSAEEIVKRLEIHRNKRIVPGRTLIFLDEIQECPRALMSLKSFCDDAPEHHVVCAGSLLGITMAGGKSFPEGKVSFLKLYPMSFMEFLDASGEGMMRQYMETKEPGEPLEMAFHERAASLLREYYVVGGFPEVVQAWVARHDPEEADRLLEALNKAIVYDFVKHAPGQVQKLRDVWESIPAQLAKENGKFMFGQVRKGGRASQLGDALQWLLDAGLVYKVSKVEAPASPLSLACDPSHFKVYMCDVGLLRVMSGKDPSFAYTAAWEDRIYKGHMSENHVLCQMLSGGARRAFFWASGNHEVDFLLDAPVGAVPVEVKSETNTRSSSLDAYRRVYSPDAAFLVSMGNAGRGETVRVPLYCAELIPGYLGRSRAGVDAWHILYGAIQSLDV